MDCALFDLGAMVVVMVVVYALVIWLLHKMKDPPDDYWGRKV